MAELLEFKYRVYLRPESRDTPLAEYFDSGDVVFSSVQLHDELLDETEDEEIFLAREGEEPSDYELDELYEILMGWEFVPLFTLHEPTEASPSTEASEVPSAPEQSVEPPTLTAPSDDKTVVISLLDCEDYEASLVLVNGEVVFSGNYWDFHPGCIGSVIAGQELAGLWDSGTESLVTALKVRFLEQDKRVVTETVPISELQYEAF